MTDPTEPLLDWCRHCGAEDVPMTFEHLPPKAADNRDPIRMLNEAGEVLREYNEGHSLPNLCAECNHGASDRGLPLAYKKWRTELIAGITTAFDAAPKRPKFSIWKSTEPIPVTHDYSLHPGRIARHVLGMLLAIQRDRWLLDTYPQLKEAYFANDGASIAPFTLHVALANLDYQYFTDELTQVTVALRPGAPSGSTSMRLAAFTPFVAAMVDGPDAPWRSTRIDQWLDSPASQVFRKRDRHIDYWMADRNNILIAKMYEGSEY